MSADNNSNINSIPTMIDLFSGCGGVTLAFKNKGYKVLAAIENNDAAAATFRANHPEVIMYQHDIRIISPRSVLEDCKLNPGELTVLSVCAPCQPFSSQNKSKKKDSRTNLLLQMIRFVKILKPKYIFMENVSGLAKGKNLRILNSLEKALSVGLKYKLSNPEILDAANYGVPQHRERLILIGSRDDVFVEIPNQSHYPPKIAEKENRSSWVKVSDAFIGLEKLTSGQKSTTDPLHKSRNHTPRNIERLINIPKNGGSRKSLPADLQLKCHKDITGYNDVYGRLDFNKPSNTLTTGCTNITKGRFAHPFEDRAITPREAARLQTFPDSYIFIGSYEQITTQIGNAVPVKFAEVFADYLLRLK